MLILTNKLMFLLVLLKLKNKMLAPIILFVYNRPEHTKKTLEALSKNRLANQSELFIFSDGIKKDANKEEAKRINDVRNVIKSKKWCKTVNIIEAKDNKGLANSIINGISTTLNKYGKAIILEDDIVTSSDFLGFMNKNLDYYKDEQQVFGISGYCYPNKIIKDTTYFLPIGSSWGWGTWLDKWNLINFNAQELLNIVNKRKLQKSMNFNGYKFYEMLVSQSNSEISSWAICFYASFFLKNGLSLFPNISLVQNIGFDDSGIHCSTDTHFSKFENKKIEYFEKIPVKIKKSIMKRIVLVPKNTILNSIFNIAKNKVL